MNQNKTADNTFDAIVIGSGIGGLTTAAILARLNKKRVLVLEKHFEIGGLTHVFSRGRYTWEVGLHYVGRMKKGMLQRVVFDYISSNRLAWLPIVNHFERFIYPGVDFFVPTSQNEYQKKLLTQFPSCKNEIKQYFRDVHKASNWFVRYYLSGFLPKPVASLLRLINYYTKKMPLTKTADYLLQNIPDKTCAALLATQWGDYGTPPDESAFVMHAVVVNHYLHGGFFPEGGANRVAANVEQVIEKNGGMILVNREVEKILIENNRAVGVRVVDKRQVTNRKQTFYAPIIVSGAGAEHTFGDLVSVPSVAPLKEHVLDLEKGYSSVTLYVGLKDSPKILGVHGENVWIHEKSGHGTMQEQTENLLAGQPDSCFVSFPTIRGGHESNHSAMIITMVDYKAFTQWRDQSWRRRDASYAAVKTTITRSLIALVERTLPGFSDLINFSELATPLTMEHFTNRARGAMYGFKQTPAFYRKKWFNVKTPVHGLYLCGTDVCSTGVTGAMMGGVATASVLNGPLGLIKIVASARIASRKPAQEIHPSAAKSFRKDYTHASDKFLAKLIKKQNVTDTQFVLTYQLNTIFKGNPGQYAQIQYADGDFGSYSIVSSNDAAITFKIDTKFGGGYADYFTSLAPGDYSTIRLHGQYHNKG